LELLAIAGLTAKATLLLWLAASAAAEQAAEEAFRLLRRLLGGLLHRLLRLLQLPFQAADTVLRLGERSLLDQRGLGYAIPRLGILLKLLGDKGVGVTVDRRQRRLRLRLRHAAAWGAEKAAALWRSGDPGDESGDKVAFFVRHGTVPGLLR